VGSENARAWWLGLLLLLLLLLSASATAAAICGGDCT